MPPLPHPGNNLFVWEVILTMRTFWHQTCWHYKRHACSVSTGLARVMLAWSAAPAKWGNRSECFENSFLHRSCTSLVLLLSDPRVRNGHEHLCILCHQEVGERISSRSNRFSSTDDRYLAGFVKTNDRSVLCWQPWFWEWRIFKICETYIAIFIACKEW